MAMGMMLVACSKTEQALVEKNEDPNFKDGIYINNHIEHPNKSIFAFLKIRFFGEESWADHQSMAHLVPFAKTNAKELLQAHDKVTWLGHSTFLIQLDGVTILTDPIFSERASPFTFAGPKRYTPTPISIEELPEIDIVVISHNHYDHLDEQTIKHLGNKPEYIVPSGLKDWFVEQGVDKESVTELKWWHHINSHNLRITATPSQHWSARGLGDRHHTHWASWLIDNGKTAHWFAGDTGYNDKDFVDIGRFIKEQALSLDLALIPIGAYAPRDFMKTYHVNTEEAVQIHKDVGSKFSIGMHWGAFPLTAEAPMEPSHWLNRLRDENKIGDKPFNTIKIGETVNL